MKFVITKNDVDRWLEERFGFSKAIAFARKKVVPHHEFSFAYYFGGALMFLAILQIITGIFLLFNYNASAGSAHESVARLMTDVPFGWLIRSIHHWGSNLMLLILFAHFFSTMLMKAYRKPRELSWLIGFGLLVSAITMGYSGYILPWDERGFFAVKVGSQMPQPMPLIGEQLKVFLRGGQQVSDYTLNRFFALHVGVMPLILLTLMVLHIVLIQIQGMSTPLGVLEKAKKTGKKIKNRPFFPYEFLRDVSNWAILFAIIITLAIIFPSNLEPPADLLKPAPEGVRPDWFFLSIYQTLKIIPTTVLGIEGEELGIVMIAIALLFIVLMPFLDRKSARGERSPVFTTISWLIFIYFILMTLWGYLS